MRSYRPIIRVKSCKYCTDYKGQLKPIMPEGLPLAKRMPDGSFKCETCQIEELKDRIIRVTPNSHRAKEIIAERESKKKERVWVS
jgi:hypothetical protein